MLRIVASGGFDPLHVGHVQYLNAAKSLGRYLTVILNGDSFLMRKKGFVFMPAEERKHILLALDCVDEVYIYDSPDDNTVIGAFERIDPFDVFAKGGDRTDRANIPEWEWCEKHGKIIACNVGGGKIQSSSWLTGKEGNRGRS